MIPVSREKAIDILLNSDGKIFSAFFRRKHNKCLACNVAPTTPKSGIKLTHCKKCGDLMSTHRQANGRLHVINPGKGITKPGTGAESTTGGLLDRLALWNNLTYYDMGVKGDRTDGHSGGYRTIPLDNLISVGFKGEVYVVMEELAAAGADGLTEELMEAKIAEEVDDMYKTFPERDSTPIPF